MFLEVSIGEAIDKYCILEIKKNNIQEPEKQKSILAELNALSECKEYIDKYPFFYSLLVHVNKVIWDTTNEMKNIYSDKNSEKFDPVAKKIFDYNDMRFRLKNNFNILLSSNIKEQKSYKEDVYTIFIENIDTIYKKICEINYLLIKHDHIIFNCGKNIENSIKNIFKNVNYSFSTNEIFELTNSKFIRLDSFSLSDTNYPSIYEFPPIKYISGGLLGDFIHQLSVIHQNYLLSGRRGILYISNIGDSFSNGLQKTYEDTFPIISNLFYIKEYKIYNREEYDINLSIWRKSPMLFNCNWHDLYKHVYDVSWGISPWIKVNTILPDWTEKVIINTTKHRFPEEINFSNLLEIHGKNLVYVGFKEAEYQHFISKTGITSIKFHKLTTLLEMCEIISSCKLIVGSLSAPMAFAQAMHKNSIASCITCDKNMQIDLDKVIKNFTLL